MENLQQKVGALIDGTSGNIAVYCTECGEMLTMVETSFTPADLLEDHEHLPHEGACKHVVVDLQKVAEMYGGAEG